MPKSYGQCSPGGPLEVAHVPLPLGVVVHAPPKVVVPKPLPALPHGTRDYIRKWATSHGMSVALVGALPKAVLAAYREALR
jgi:hypothetical protein